MKQVFIIAEAGINHNGDLILAKKMIDVACETGVDAIKFQTFKADKVVSRFAPKAEYQKETTSKDESQLEMVKKLELDKKEHEELIAYCKKREIIFISSPFDIESIEFLDSMGLEILKIPSGEITNLPYLRKIGCLGKRIILSTGMADLGEIEDALEVLTSIGTRKGDITILHCNTEYPTPMEDVNLLAMITIRDAFKVSVGYSDHTRGIEIPIAAAVMGASVIEKHFTLDRTMEGPDHKSSIEPQELISMVKAIRNIESALGDGIKKPSKSELKNKPIARKSIVAAKNIKSGEVFSKDNITTKRPGTGISPMLLDNVLGNKAKKDFVPDEMIEI